jgi:hypothetical protein
MTLFQRIATPLAIVSAIALTGCLKSNQTYTLYPDGSGKVEMKFTFLGMMAQMIKAGGPQGMGGGDEGGPGGGQKIDPYDAVKKNFSGKIYWANLHTEDGADGSYSVYGTGYFDDVNQLKPDKGTISWTKNADGGNTFEITQETPDELKGMGGDDAKKTPEQKQQEAQMKAMMKGMLAGFEMKIAVVMPGAVKSAEGMTPGEGRNAQVSMNEQDVQDIMDKKKTPPTKMKVVAGAPSGLDDELAKFKKDLADAKANDGKAPAAEPKKDAPKGDAPKGDAPKTGDKKGDF